VSSRSTPWAASERSPSRFSTSDLGELNLSPVQKLPQKGPRDVQNPRRLIGRKQLAFRNEHDRIAAGHVMEDELECTQDISPLDVVTMVEDQRPW
jgi:hypothetical protein